METVVCVLMIFFWSNLLGGVQDNKEMKDHCENISTIAKHIYRIISKFFLILFSDMQVTYTSYYGSQVEMVGIHVSRVLLISWPEEGNF